ncbi:legumain-like [Myzus persicae]|uniref:legumain n=1 Tax=Clitoria ternatea TaxID=43366 RepID=A0A7G5F3G2_CLITE|nr:legumain-like [Myzus persicae]QMV80787.1 asparaginyl endopeptidase 9 [Clitoria ternatea]
MGVFSLVSLALFAIGSFAAHVPKSTANEESFVGGKKWVVLVAGSEGWSNYRHQADICHAYQIVKENGIPEENIITMMVDDIAYNSRNPTPGKIINKPKGNDVYQGVIIDYKGDDVNKSNFLKIITGDQAGMRSIGTGKVVLGGQLDRIFINFVDHGASGLLGFPDDYLYADELNDAFTTMNNNESYKKMLLYIEACKAGSMFDGILSEDTNIFAVTASGPRESSYGCYCQSESGPYKTCLGDLFSVTWMEDLDKPTSKQSARKRTVFNDFTVTRTNVTKSNVMIYGDLDTGSEKLSSFIGYRGSGGDDSSFVQQSDELNIKNTASSRDVHESSVKYELEHDMLSLPEALKLTAKLRKNNEMRSVIDSVFRDIYSEVVKERPDVKSEIGEYDEPNNLKLNLAMFPCYRSVLNLITENCFSLPKNPYVLDHLTVFANMCVADNQIHEMVGSIVTKSCSNIPKNIINVQ